MTKRFEEIYSSGKAYGNRSVEVHYIIDDNAVDSLLKFAASIKYGTATRKTVAETGEKIFIGQNHDVLHISKSGKTLQCQRSNVYEMQKKNLNDAVQKLKEFLGRLTDLGIELNQEQLSTAVADIAKSNSVSIRDLALTARDLAITAHDLAQIAKSGDEEINEEEDEEAEK